MKRFLVSLLAMMAACASADQISSPNYISGIPTNGPASTNAPAIGWATANSRIMTLLPMGATNSIGFTFDIVRAPTNKTSAIHGILNPQDIEVFRTLTPNDGNSWVKVGTLSTNATSFIDNNAVVGVTNYYQDFFHNTQPDIP